MGSTTDALMSPCLLSVSPAPPYILSPSPSPSLWPFKSANPALTPYRPSVRSLAHHFARSPAHLNWPARTATLQHTCPQIRFSVIPPFRSTDWVRPPYRTTALQSVRLQPAHPSSRPIARLLIHPLTRLVTFLSSKHLSVCPSVIVVCFFVCPPVRLPVGLLVGQYVCHCDMSVCISVFCPTSRLSVVYLSSSPVCLYAWLSVRLSVYLSVCLSVVQLSVYLSLLSICIPIFLSV